jgi:hypothetical protein
VTLPVATRLLTDGFALGFRCLTVSYAVWLLANSYALRAVEHFATFIGAFDFTFRLLALDIADSILRFSAGCVTFGRLAHRVANSRAVRVVALPGTLRMTLGLCSKSGAHAEQY